MHTYIYIHIYIYIYIYTYIHTGAELYGLDGANRAQTNTDIHTTHTYVFIHTGAELYDLEDAIRVARSRVRSYLNDSDYYDPDHWLCLDRNKVAKDGKSPGFWPFT